MEKQRHITRVNNCKRSTTKTGFRCIEWPPSLCSGEMIVRSHDRACLIWRGDQCDCGIKCRTWVGAHRLPVFVQCSGCGYAPDDAEQLVMMGRMLAKK